MQSKKLKFSISHTIFAVLIYDLICLHGYLTYSHFEHPETADQ